jgi:hypothetical protein
MRAIAFRDIDKKNGNDLEPGVVKTQGAGLNREGLLREK